MTKLMYTGYCNLASCIALLGGSNLWDTNTVYMSNLPFIERMNYNKL